MIVRQLFDMLSPGYVAASGVHFGKDVEIDVFAFEKGKPTEPITNTGDRGIATIHHRPPR